MDDDSIRIPGLTANTTYEFRVTGFRCTGKQLTSAPTATRTTVWTPDKYFTWRNCWIYPEQPPPPSRLSASKTAVMLSLADSIFRPPDLSLSRPPTWIRSTSKQYCRKVDVILEVARCQDYENDGEPFVLVKDHDCGPHRRACTVRDLQPGSSYQFRAQINNNAMISGTSAVSEPSDCFHTAHCRKDHDCARGTCNKETGACQGVGMVQVRQLQQTWGTLAAHLFYLLCACVIGLFACHYWSDFQSATEYRPTKKRAANMQGFSMLSSRSRNMQGLALGFCEADDETHSRQFQFCLQRRWWQYLRRHQERFDVTDLLSAGAYGRVFLIKEATTGKLRAMKLLHRDGKDECKELQNLQEELRRMHPDTGGRRPNVLHCCHFQRQPWVHPDAPKERFMLLEFAALGSLDDFVKPARGLGGFQKVPEKVCCLLFRDLVRGLGAIHSAGFVHLDIKPANLLLSRHGQLQVGDFGLMLPLGHQEKGRNKGTKPYAAPDASHARYTEACDVWSAMVTLVQLWIGKRPPDSFADAFAGFSDDGSSRTFLEDAHAHMPDDLQDVFRNVFQHLPQASPALLDGRAGAVDTRWSLQQVQSSPWFQRSCAGLPEGGGEGDDSGRRNLAEALSLLNRPRVERAVRQQQGRHATPFLTDCQRALDAPQAGPLEAFVRAHVNKSEEAGQLLAALQKLGCQTVGDIRGQVERDCSDCDCLSKCAQRKFAKALAAHLSSVEADTQ